MKTNKAFTKRLKITRTGKVIARKPGQNHFNAKESRSTQMDGRRSQSLNLSKQVTQRYITTASKSKN
ncbi:MAG: 50S ribosomal protein L35 [Candidatus Adlerbacteria bacterium]|nr:50S ribosomal protein L35 [Candidatus Adlerbacteria bacterium]MDZ4226400.1 50S ribosomal protein L35 [Patescibacteria group bacterium]